MTFHRIAHWLMLLAFCSIVGCSSDDASNAEEELPDEVAVVVGKEGGKVAAKGVTIDIPAGALDKAVTITAKPASKAKTPEKVKPLSKVYEFGPKGTVFKKDITVSFATEKEAPSAAVYFTKENSSEFEKLPSTNKDREVAAKVKHFSMGFAGEGEDDSPTNEPDSGVPAPDAGEEEPDASTDEEPDVGEPIPTTRIRVLSNDKYGRAANQSWAAYRDGNGAWQALTPTQVGSYEFNVAEDTYTVAFVCADGSLASEGIVLLAATSQTEQRVEASQYCLTSTPAEYTLSGNLMPATFYSRMAWGHSFYRDEVPDVPIGGGQQAYSFTNVPANVPVDVVVGLIGGNSFVEQAFIARDITLSANTTRDIDTSGIFSLSYGSSFSIGNASVDTQLKVHLATRNANEGLSLVWRGAGGAYGGTLPVRSVQYDDPTTQLDFLPADNLVFEGWEESSSATRRVRLRTKTGGNVTLQLPPTFEVNFVQDSSSFVLPKMHFDSVQDAAHYALSVSEPPGGPVRTFTVKATPAWFAASQHPAPEGYEHELALPDLTSAPGFDTGWLHAVQNGVYVTGAVRSSSNGLGGVVDMDSSRTEPSNIPI